MDVIRKKNTYRTPGAGLKQNRSKRIVLRVVLLFVLLAPPLIPQFNCNYIVDVVRFATQESYVSGKEARNRIETAALIGYALNYNADMANANTLAPLTSIIITNIKEDREYLETQVETCEDSVFISNALSNDPVNQALTGFICNLGPGKRADQL